MNPSLTETMTFNDLPCEVRTACSTCLMEDRRHSFRLNGVCEESQVDSYYVWEEDFTLLTGYLNSVMKFSSSRERWEISTSLNTTLLAFTNQTREFPVGKRAWYILDTNCTDPVRETRTLNLHLSVEQPGQFCCAEGSCISSQLVCDNVPHCPDGSDEYRNCSLIYDTDQYNSAAARLHGVSGHVSINTTFTYLQMFDINESQSFIDIYFELHLRWYNKSLKFQFLNDADKKNTMPEYLVESVWTPRIGYKILKNELKPGSKKIFVSKRGSPELSEDGETEVYNGTDNPLNLRLQERIKDHYEKNNIIDL